MEQVNERFGKFKLDEQELETQKTNIVYEIRGWLATQVEIFLTWQNCMILFCVISIFYSSFNNPEIFKLFYIF